MTSKLKVDEIVNSTDTGSPSFPYGVTFAGAVSGTSASFSGNVSSGGDITATGNVTVAGGVLSPQTGFKNRIINGDMRIDQRSSGASTTVTSSGYYTVDRWLATVTQASKYSVQQNAGSVAPPSGFTKYLGITSLSTYSLLAADSFQVKQNIEGNNVSDLAWGTADAQPITISFWVRSSLTGNFGLVVTWGSASGNQRSYPILYNISSSNTWEYKTIIIPGDTTMAAGGFETGAGVGIQVRFSLGGGATSAGASGSWSNANYQTVVGDVSVVSTNGATFYLTGVQVEKSSVATPFEFRSIGQELALCQRYFEKGKTYVIGTNASAANSIAAVINFCVTKRAQPTVTLSNFVNVVNTDQQSVLSTNSDGSGFTHAFRIITGLLNSAGSGDWQAAIEL